MIAPSTSTIEPRNLLVSGGVPAGPPIPAQRCPSDHRIGTDVAPMPADESPTGRADWHVEVVGTTWMRIP